MNAKTLKSQVITTAEIHKFLEAHENLGALRRRIEALTLAASHLERSLLEKIEVHATLPPGFEVRIRDITPLMPRWRHPYLIAKAQQEAVAKALEPVEPEFYKTVVITPRLFVGKR
jgi:hypothetical protein